MWLLISSMALERRDYMLYILLHMKPTLTV